MIKKKKTFPDLNKDGKITYADILKGRGIEEGVFKRIAAGSKEKMRKPGTKGSPTAANFKRAAKTAKKKKG